MRAAETMGTKGQRPFARFARTFAIVVALALAVVGAIAVSMLPSREQLPERNAEFAEAAE